MVKFWIIFSCVLLVSCQKEVTNEDTIEINTPQSISLFDGTWVVRDAKLYLTNRENGDKIFYDHFSPTKSHSSMRLGGSIRDVEDIIKDTTTWNFIEGYNGIGRFYLNGDDSNLYGFSYFGQSFSIIENPDNANDGSENDLNGSAIPFTGKYLGENKIQISIMHVGSTVNINSEQTNVSYFTLLTLEKI